MKNPKTLEDEQSIGAEVQEMSKLIEELLRPGLASLVQQIAAQVSSRRESHPTPAPEAAPPSGKTFKELADSWLAVESKRLVAPDNEARHVAHIQSVWAMTERELTPKVARAAILATLQPVGLLGPNSANKVHSTARRIIREAQINGEWLGQNPFELVPRLKEIRPVHEVVTIAEARLFLPQLRPDRRRMALAMLFLGTRPGELIALRKSDVDMGKRELTIRRSRSRDRTKTGAIRRVPIPDELLIALRDSIAASPSEFVFCGTDGGKMRDDTKLARCLQDSFRKAGLVTGYEYVCAGKGCGLRETLAAREPRRCFRCDRRLLIYGVPRPVRFYDLRHSAATLHREAGCDPRVIQLVLGHAASNTTDDIYTHLSPSYLRLELNKLSLYTEWR